MNLKAIDAALSAYRGSADTTDKVRFDFFRELWAVQDSIASEIGETSNAVVFKLPSQDALVAGIEDEQAVLLYAPATITPEVLSDAISRIATFLVEQGSFESAVKAGLERTRWDRMVAASETDLAGSDPNAYVEEFEALLMDDGLDADAAHTGALAASLALRALLDGVATQVAAGIRSALPDGTHPVHCPVCGGQAAAARVGDTQTRQGRGKELWCAQCGCTWDFERVRCARCGTQNQAHLHYFNLEGDEAHRLATCDECGMYVRTVYQEDALAPFSFEVEDVVMAKLDLIATDPRFQAESSAEDAE